ncbi:MAG: long-chain fatty acid--CoA ligase [Acidobacteriia bacterium]|nr:long-chain fatty acid--CoA ligase [Terriglobia bacterium]
MLSWTLSSRDWRTRPVAVSTLNDVFYAGIDRDHDRVMMFKQTVKWIPISSRELYRDVVGTAKSLARWDVHKGDRVAILSENRPEWAVADYATLLLGAVVVPIYPTLTAEQTAHILRDSGARIIFVSTIEQMKKVEAIKDQTRLEQIVVMDYVGVPNAVPMHRLMVNQTTQRDPDFDARAKEIKPDDLATIIFTSGTTGMPKGAMLTHGNLAANLSVSMARSNLTPQDVSISFLPLSHVTARHLDYVLFYYGVTLAYCPDFNQLTRFLLEVKPTMFVAVPRVYEKIAHRVRQETASGLKRAIYEWALKVGRAHRDQVLAGKIPSSSAWKLANALVYSKIRRGMGGRVTSFISGGAPLGFDLADWYACMGIRILEGYGLTETSPVIAINTPDECKIGTVGKPLPNVQIRIADDGEILVKGPSIFPGYWNMPDETKNAFVDGWFKTGDIGILDQDGFLAITDRKRDLLKTSGGKFIAPQPIEVALKMNPMVGHAVVIGDRRKFASVVISPNFLMLEDWAQAAGIDYKSREGLIADPRTRKMYDDALAVLNAKLAQFETIKKVLLVPDDFTVQTGELTASMKIKRRVIEEKYRSQIDALYSTEPEALSSETVTVV